MIEVPIRHFLDANTIVWEDWTLRGQPVRVPFFDVNGHKVWGATAMVLAEFAAVLEAVEGGEWPAPLSLRGASQRVESEEGRAAGLHDEVGD